MMMPMSVNYHLQFTLQLLHFQAIRTEDRILLILVFYVVDNAPKCLHSLIYSFLCSIQILGKISRFLALLSVLYAQSCFDKQILKFV